MITIDDLSVADDNKVPVLVIRLDSDKGSWFIGTSNRVADMTAYVAERLPWNTNHEMDIRVHPNTRSCDRAIDEIVGIGVNEGYSLDYKPIVVMVNARNSHEFGGPPWARRVFAEAFNTVDTRVTLMHE